MRRTKEDSQQTRFELLHVAVKVFNEKGYSSARLEDIAKEAGVTRGAIYHHFGGKAEIFKALVKANKDQTRDFMTKEMEIFKGTMLQTLQHIFIKFLVRLETDEYFRNVETLLYKTDLTGELDELEQIYKLETNDSFSQLIMLLEKGKKDKSIRDDLDSETFAFSIMSFIYGIMTMWLSNQELISIKQKASQLSEYIFKVCKPLRIRQ